MVDVALGVPHGPPFPSSDQILTIAHVASTSLGVSHVLFVARDLVIPSRPVVEVHVIPITSDLKGWKDVLTNLSLVAKFSLPCLEVEIYVSSTKFSIPKAISNKIVSSMEKVVVKKFFSFFPTVDMVRRWASANCI